MRDVMSMGSVKRMMLNAVLVPGFPGCLRYVQRDCATVFMLHRFEDADRGIAGCSIPHLRRALTYLTGNGYEIVSLMELFRRLGGEGPQARGAVAFTIDDGYFEQATVAAPVFSEFRCPATTFLTTGFLDGKFWFWWDQVEYIFRHALCQRVEVRFGERVHDYRWENEGERGRAQADFTEECKRVPGNERAAAIARLARLSGVEVPKEPPPCFAPMSWDQVRLCEGMGMSFGPHTVTHPILSCTTRENAGYEIAESWARLRAEARSPVPIFCYPNGAWSDFGDREIVELRRLGFLGAVVAEPGYANALTFQSHPDNRFRVQRFGFPDGMPHMIQYVSGVERLKQMLRRAT